MEIALTKAQLAMAHVESACGRSGAVKEMAAAAMRDAKDRMRLFRNQGSSTGD